MADFTGFKFGNIHSSDLGIVRVSGGDRYDEALHPEIKDRTTEIPGLNGEYYFGSDFGTRSFDIEIAFDHLTEKQFRKLRKVFGTKQIQPLVFDECPYKKYMAKLESPVELSYICFDEPIKVKFSEKYNVGTIDTSAGAIGGEILSELPDGVRMVDDGQGNRVREKVDPWIHEEGKERVYKGEGKMTFICHFPFAKSNFKVLPEEGNEYYEGSDEWAISSGILSLEDKQAKGIDVYNNGIIRIHNPGDVETGFRLYVPSSAVNQTITLTYEGARLVIDPITLKENSFGSTDSGVIIDTNTGLINGLIPSTMTIEKKDDNTGEIIEVEEVNEVIHIDYNGNAFYTTSGNIYNENVNAGYFFKLQPNQYDYYEEYPTLQIESAGTDFQIFYDYLYF